ncbi:peptide ABC transporter substrate-binding protein [Aphanothece sacrum]|uniref:Extracellular solute-binding protein family 1 n=1 Tax=Aphanothece sacrum FPU1 TaxID=1920663 RepID=A0A401IJ45_APHSA|nr:peptide ABC transporter substrate-binding protein [Aphanothece sacrum]GBF81335.1 extracellular solute-binding protein family 1 [Aphanothece sacrum FPU1]GBF86142.1 extracellular solute-binding protein family 5 [Aphanothece sacrum FPU3]
MFQKLFNRSFLNLLVCVSLGSSFVLSGCNPKTETPNASVPSQTQNDTLKLLYWQAPTILNPHLSTGFKDSEASRITLEPLASYDKNSQLIPFLAAEIPTIENGGIAKDGKSVTWNLKQNIKWSDGTPFTADDVVFTYQFITNNKVGSTSAETYTNIVKVEALDKYTVKITFKTSTPSWDRPFTGTSGMILPRHSYEKYNGENARQAPANLIPIGTGPYKVIEFKPGDVVVYEANSYFRDEDKLGFKRIELKGGGDATSAARAVLQTGDANYAYNLQVEAPILKQLETGGQGKIISLLGPLSERILVNLSDPNQTTKEGERSNLKFSHPFFNDKKVREAFSLAVDRDTIAQQLYGVTGKPTANFLILPQEYNSPNTSYEFNLEKASQLLDEAGWKDTNNNRTRDKNGVEMKVLLQSSVNTLRQKTQEIIKQGLQKIGVGVELKSIDPSVFFSSDPANNDTVEHFYADLQMFTTGNDNPDPSTYMKTYTCNTIPQKANNWSGDNYSRYCNPEYDQLWEASNKELDPKKRAEIFIKMNDILVKDFVVIPLVHRAEVAAINNQLQGFDLTPWDRNTWNIKDWKVK